MIRRPPRSTLFPLHDALPICPRPPTTPGSSHKAINLGIRPQTTGGKSPITIVRLALGPAAETDRKSTRLNSSHQIISYAVFCLKKKKVVTYVTARHDLQS